MEWIKVEDRLPPYYAPVLARVAFQTETIIAARYEADAGSWFEQSEYEEITGDARVTHCLDDYRITHWMPLPEPPEDRWMDIKQCPCGETPETLCISDAGQGGKCAMASCTACGEWETEFRTSYAALDSDECMEYAVDAWNRLPRFWEDR